MKVLQIKCPHCQQPIYSKVRDLAFYCPHCKTMHIRDGGINVIDFDVAEFHTNSPPDRVYMPFWRLFSGFTINQSNVAGGMLHKLGRLLKGTANGGNIFIYIPAWETDVDEFKRWAMNLTEAQPMYSLRLDFNNVERAPTVVPKEEAMKMADFVIVTMEAEKPGTLQYLDYQLQVHDARLIYLPFIKGEGGVVPGF
ncbi:MAG TPA: hypothetical protein VMW85_06825 [Methanomassiliicoccales archaeon]|nr:hypothetical protein [Methanomassiliicoccales archaeon]